MKINFAIILLRRKYSNFPHPKSNDSLILEYFKINKILLGIILENKIEMKRKVTSFLLFQNTSRISYQLYYTIYFKKLDRGPVHKIKTLIRLFKTISGFIQCAKPYQITHILTSHYK